MQTMTAMKKDIRTTVTRASSRPARRSGRRSRVERATRAPRPKGTDWGAIGLSLPAPLYKQLATEARVLGVKISQAVAAAIELWSARVRLGRREPLSAPPEGKRHEFCVSLPREVYGHYEELREKYSLSRSDAVMEALPILFAEIRAVRAVARAGKAAGRKVRAAS